MIGADDEAIGKGRGRRLSGTAPRLYELAEDVVVERVMSGALPAGTQLTESMLAEQFGISRAPARRALQELARKGVVERKQGRGYAVLRCAGAVAVASGVAAVEPLPLLSLPTWERIYGEVENEIVARISFADWRLNEVQLAHHYHVSRTVARDVVSRLHQRGLVRKDESSRWFAPALTRERVEELYELRGILEPAAVVLAAPRVPPEVLAKMRASLDAAVSAPPGDVPTLDALEHEMHVTLLGYCGNQALMQALVLPQMLLLAHRFLYRWTPTMFGDEPFPVEHREILDHLGAGEAELAAAAMKRHLEVACARVLQRVEAVRHERIAADLPYLERIKPG